MAGFEWELDMDEDVDVADPSESPLHEQPDPADFDVDPRELEKELDSAAGSGLLLDLNAFSKTTAGLKIARMWFRKKRRAKMSMKAARMRRMAEQEKGRDEGGRL